MPIEPFDPLQVEIAGSLFWLEEGKLVCAPLLGDGSWLTDEESEPETGDPKVWAALREFLILAEKDRENW